MDYKEVARAAAALSADGIRPTVLLVRARIGRGSLRDITPMLKQWKSEQQGERTTPSILPKHLAQAISSLLEEEKRRAVQSIRTELEAVIRERDELIGILSSREEEVQRIQEEKAMLQGKLEMTNDAFEALKNELEQERACRIEAEKQQAILSVQQSINNATREKDTPTEKKTRPATVTRKRPAHS